MFGEKKLLKMSLLVWHVLGQRYQQKGYFCSFLLLFCTICALERLHYVIGILHGVICHTINYIILTDNT